MPLESQLTNNPVYICCWLTHCTLLVVMKGNGEFTTKENIIQLLDNNIEENPIQIL